MSAAPSPSKAPGTPSSGPHRSKPPAPRPDRVVASVPEPPWQPLTHREVFDRVDAKALEARRRRARFVHQMRVTAQQGLAGGTTDAAADTASLASDASGGEADMPAASSISTTTAPSSAPAAVATSTGPATAPPRHVDPAATTPQQCPTSRSPDLPLVSSPQAAGMGDPSVPSSDGPASTQLPLPASASSTLGTSSRTDASSSSQHQQQQPPAAAERRGSASAASFAELPNPGRIQAHFAAGGRLEIADAQQIIRAATEVLRAEPNVLRLAGPLTVCGDVHGQFYDVLNIFKLGGDPDSTQYLFLGDYVDRGSFSTEIVLTLFARKLVRPFSLWMLRGNHECSYLTSYFNFRQECLHKYDEATYELFLAAFDCLPLAAVVNGEFLCVHGGLSPFIRTVDDIDTIDRFRDPPQRGPMCDLLWADPMEDEEEELCPDALFLHNELRGCSYVYTHTAACDFLQRNGLAALIRAHEAQEEGFRMYRKVPATGMPATICVFSAPNYCEFNNLAAILLVDGRQLQVKQFHSSPQPYCLPHFMNAFTWSMPFVFEKLDHVLADVWELTEDDPYGADRGLGLGSGSGPLHTPGKAYRVDVSSAGQGSPTSAAPPSSSDLAARIAAAGRAARQRREGDATGAGSAAPATVPGAATRNSPSDDVAHSVPTSELARAAAHVVACLAAAMNRCLLPRVLRRRGGVMRIKVLAAVRFIRILRTVRGATGGDGGGDLAAVPAAPTSGTA